jgi:hypothetical protein
VGAVGHLEHVPGPRVTDEAGRQLEHWPAGGALAFQRGKLGAQLAFALEPGLPRGDVASPATRRSAARHRRAPPNRDVDERAAPFSV